jgi:hypothetical protein
MEGATALFVRLRRSSWAVHPKYPGHGMALLAAALRDENVTYASFTPRRPLGRPSSRTGSCSWSRI